MGKQPTVDEKTLEEIAAFANKSARTLRRWMDEKPSKFRIYYDNYMEELNKLDAPDHEKATIIVAASLKGGVGKSTFSDALGYYLDDSIVINLDLAQSAAEVNACKTIDYVDVMDEESIDDLITRVAQEYRYVIIDTPGEVNGVVSQALHRASKLIIPMTVGKRARKATETTLHAFFGEDTPLSGRDYDVFFIFNMFTKAGKRDEAAELFKAAYTEFKPHAKVNIRPFLGALDASNAFSTAEEAGKSIFQLVQENRAAYEVAAKKLTAVCQLMEKHFNL